MKCVAPTAPHSWVVKCSAPTQSLSSRLVQSQNIELERVHCRNSQQNIYTQIIEAQSFFFINKLLQSNVRKFCSCTLDLIDVINYLLNYVQIPHVVETRAVDI